MWAKKKESKYNGSLLWLPLIQHLEDTKNVAVLLWKRWLSKGQKNLIKDSLKGKTDVNPINLVKFIALTHDWGKSCSAFQTKPSFISSEIDDRILEKLESAGFKGLNSLSLPNRQKTPHNIASQYLLHEFGVADDIAAIVGAHHGKPADDITTTVFGEFSYLDQNRYTENYYQVQDSESDIHKHWEATQKEVFEWALSESGFASVDELPTIGRPAQVILLGLLIMADWIASNEKYFPLIDIDEDEVPDKELRINGYYEWESNGAWVPDHIGDIDAAYKKRFGFCPRDVQEMFSKLIEETCEPGIYILEAPMGIGKTEAALIAAEQLSYKLGCNGVFFGLPTQATSNGIFPRILAWLESVGKDNGTVSLRLSHSKAYLNKTFSDLPDSENIYDEAETHVTVNNWFSGRKTAVLDEFVVGTVDQFLMTALKQKHLALRHLGFSKKVIVIDEVHAYDAYMNQYLLQAIKWMGAYKIPVILLSATLPSEKRLELIKNYMIGLGYKTLNFEGMGGEAYPVITYNDGCEIKQYKNSKISNEKKVKIVRINDDNLIGLIENLISGGGVVGMVLNTVKRAQELGRILSEYFGEENVEVFHSGFIAADRAQKEENLIRSIGKNGNRPYKKIIIGTQVLEQSLDIDFDVMISDLAPMDLLIQRIGRLHRHYIERPGNLKDAVCYVLGCSDDLEFEEGAAVIYGDYLLTRTQHFLPDQIVLPLDISRLVQLVYGEDKVPIREDLQEKYLAREERYNSEMKSKKRQANTYRIGDPFENKCGQNLIGWLKNTISEDSDEKAYAQVRDGEDIIEVIALKKIGDGYGPFGRNKDIACEICDNDIAKDIARNTLNLPRLFSKEYNIDKSIEALERYNKTYLGEWQESKWLKGALGIIFDEKNEFEIAGYKMIYDKRLGIMIERK